MFEQARNFINKNPQAAVGITAGLLVVALLIVMLQMCGSPPPPPPAEDVWYYDLGTKQHFADSRTRLPPFDTPSGPDNGVRLYRYSCGDCSNPDEVFNGWIERYSEKALAKLKEIKNTNAGDDPEAMEQAREVISAGVEVREVETDQPWVARDSKEGEYIREEPDRRCKGAGNAKRCTPKNEQAG